MYLHHHDNPRLIITQIHNISSSLQYNVLRISTYSIGAGGTHYASKFIDPHGSQDQPSAQEFTKYVGSRPAPTLESALVRLWSY